MFVIVHNGFVHLGPMPWRKLFFENCLQDDLEIAFTLPQSNTAPITIDENTYILPAEFLPDPEFNPKIQGLNGPFWEFTEDRAIGHHVAVDLPIDLVQSQLKGIVATNRYTEEIKGTKITLQGTEVTLDTSRDGRNTFLQAFQLGSNNIKWKFPEGWLTLTNSELQSCVVAIMTHVQTVFEWESLKVEEIYSKGTLVELAEVVTDYVV